MYLEEICLSTNAVDPEVDQPLSAAEKTAVLAQVNRMRRCRSEFTLFNNQSLSVKSQRFMQDDRDYTIDIGMLDPLQKRILKIGWNYLLGSVALCGAASFLAFSDLALNTTLLSVSLAILAGISLILAVYRSHDRIVFYSQHGRAPLVVLFNRLPDKAALDAFTDALVESIKDAKDHNRYANETLNEELKEHRRLMEEGIISTKRYAIVKKRILSQHSL